MLPYVFIGNIKISLVGIGIVISLLTFLWISKYLCKKYNLKFSNFFFSFPYYFIIIYFFWKYIDYILVTKDFIPSLANIIKIFGLYNEFHMVGIILGIVVSLFIMLYKRRRNEAIKTMDMLFYSGMYSTIVLWLFLIFSDTFTGKAHTGRFSIEALVSYSKIVDIWSIYPLGIILSIVAALAIGIAYIYKKQWGTAVGFFWLGVFFILLNIVFYFQSYPKYLVMNIWWNIFDIKNYIATILGVFLIGLGLSFWLKYKIKSKK